MSLTAPRRKTRRVMIGDVAVGGGAPISIQSMTNTRTDDVEATVAQIRRLESVGCDIVRCAVPDTASARALERIVASVAIPVVADVHFDSRLGVAAVEAGAHALRINPGNIGGRERVETLTNVCAERGVPIRVGVNAGSLEKDILERDGRPTAAGMAESARRQVALMEDLGFEDLILSLKSSDVAATVEANRIVAAECDYPLHLGVTEAGTVLTGTARSSVGLALLLAEGIGDTVRVSLSGPVEEEVLVARATLGALGLAGRGVTVLACPTCGRTSIDVASVARDVEQRTACLKGPLVVAVMGCAVNGPGEAREADVGVAGGGGEALLFRRGEVIERIVSGDIVARLLAEIESLLKEA